VVYDLDTAKVVWMGQDRTEETLDRFFAGLPDYTYGTATKLPWGVDFGDGIPRHAQPTPSVQGGPGRSRAVQPSSAAACYVRPGERYRDQTHLLSILNDKVIAPAEKLAQRVAGKRSRR